MYIHLKHYNEHALVTLFLFLFSFSSCDYLHILHPWAKESNKAYSQLSNILTNANLIKDYWSNTHLEGGKDSNKHKFTNMTRCFEYLQPFDASKKIKMQILQNGIDDKLLKYLPKSPEMNTFPSFWAFQTTIILHRKIFI